MKERVAELPQQVEQELKADIEPVIEVLGQIRELSVGKKMNVDRTFRPID